MRSPRPAASAAAAARSVAAAAIPGAAVRAAAISAAAAAVSAAAAAVLAAVARRGAGEHGPWAYRQGFSAAPLGGEGGGFSPRTGRGFKRPQRQRKGFIPGGPPFLLKAGWRGGRALASGG